MSDSDMVRFSLARRGRLGRRVNLAPSPVGFPLSSNGAGRGPFGACGVAPLEGAAERSRGEYETSAAFRPLLSLVKFRGSEIDGKTGFTALLMPAIKIERHVSLYRMIALLDPVSSASLHVMY